MLVDLINSSGASGGGNLAFVGDASQVSCVIRIYRLFEWAVRGGHF